MKRCPKCGRSYTETRINLKETFPGQLKKCMAAAGMSMSELSRVMRTGNSRVHEWLQGGNLPSASALVKLADIFGVSVDTLLKGEENENN